MKLAKFLLTLIIFISVSFVVKAQDPLGGRDLSQVKVEALTDNQISAIQQKLKQSGMTIDQVESQAIAKGMSPTEFAKLKDRDNGKDLGIVVLRLNGQGEKSVSDWVCLLRLEDAVKLLRDAGYGDKN